MANRPAGTYEVDPISRIEGHLGVKVTTDGAASITNAEGSRQPVAWLRELPARSRRQRRDHVRAAHLRRLPGSARHDLDLRRRHRPRLQRWPHHVRVSTATNGVPQKAVHIRNLVLGVEFLMSSITHFYHLAAPSYIQGPAIPPWTPYFADSYYSTAHCRSGTDALRRACAFRRSALTGFSDDLWSTVIRSYVKALRIRRLTFEAGALFAGRMPMTSVYIGGGVTFDGTERPHRAAADHHVRGPRQGGRPLRRPGVRADRSRPRRSVPGRTTTRNNVASA